MVRIEGWNTAPRALDCATYTASACSVLLLLPTASGMLYTQLYGENCRYACADLTVLHLLHACKWLNFCSIKLHDECVYKFCANAQGRNTCKNHSNKPHFFIDFLWVFNSMEKLSNTLIPRSAPFSLAGPFYFSFRGLSMMIVRSKSHLCVYFYCTLKKLLT